MFKKIISLFIFVSGKKVNNHIGIFFCLKTVNLVMTSGIFTNTKHFVTGFFCFHVVKPLMSILPLLIILSICGKLECVTSVHLTEKQNTPRQMLKQHDTQVLRCQKYFVTHQHAIQLCCAILRFTIFLHHQIYRTYHFKTLYHFK